MHGILYFAGVQNFVPLQEFIQNAVQNMPDLPSSPGGGHGSVGVVNEVHVNDSMSTFCTPSPIQASAKTVGRKNVDHNVFFLTFEKKQHNND